ncbi:hypothetical protein ON010_g15845 [Phytophthora cinnamomi]|nr:hypothetical protein ON010_g15845 [Phytophthora cinnamomi]
MRIGAVGRCPEPLHGTNDRSLAAAATHCTPAGGLTAAREREMHGAMLSALVACPGVGSRDSDGLALAAATICTASTDTAVTRDCQRRWGRINAWRLNGAKSVRSSPLLAPEAGGDVLCFANSFPIFLISTAKTQNIQKYRETRGPYSQQAVPREVGHSDVGRAIASSGRRGDRTMVSERLPACHGGR